MSTWPGYRVPRSGLKHRLFLGLKPDTLNTGTMPLALWGPQPADSGCWDLPVSIIMFHVRPIPLYMYYLLLSVAIGLMQYCARSVSMDQTRGDFFKTVDGWRTMGKEEKLYLKYVLILFRKNPLPFYVGRILMHLPCHQEAGWSPHEIAPYWQRAVDGPSLHLYCWQAGHSAVAVVRAALLSGLPCFVGPCLTPAPAKVATLFISPHAYIRITDNRD